MKVVDTEQVHIGRLTRFLSDSLSFGLLLLLLFQKRRLFSFIGCHCHGKGGTQGILLWDMYEQGLLFLCGA